MVANQAHREQSEPKGESVFDFSKNRNQMLIIEAVRIAFLMAILLITLSFQAFQPEFVNIEVLLPTYLLLAGAFALNAIYLFFLDEALAHWPTIATLFAIESVFITALIYYTGVNQSIFLFLYLVNIILCGFVFQRAGAIILCLWTSILFSFLMIVGPEMHGQTLFFAVGLNNLSFFAVAILSGFLSEQLNFMGSALAAQGKDLRALKNLNALIIDNIATGLVTVDSFGVILQVNRAAADILEKSADALVGDRLESVLPELLTKIRALPLASEAGHEADAERFDHFYESPNGDRLTLEVIVSALPNDSAMSGFIITFQDLTRFRRLEYQMRQNEKMAAVGGLAAGIAHEIRNPLASISGSIQLLGSAFSSPQAEEQRLMAIALREIDRLNGLITEFLDFVRPETLKDDPVELNSLIRDVAEMIKYNKLIRQDVQQALRLVPIDDIAGNRDKLKQALLNIVINAYQAMQDTPNPAINIETGKREGRVFVKIRDNGCGIDEAGLRKIFEPFHTTKPKGTGLGLAVTHKIIENHGGEIFVESAKGVGTEFTLEFPTRTIRAIDKNALADSEAASENFSKAFRGQKRGNG